MVHKTTKKQLIQCIYLKPQDSPMINIYLAVTDLELMAAQVVKSVLILLLAFGVIFNLYKTFRPGTFQMKMVRGSIAFLFLFFAVSVFKWIQVDGNLLYAPKYTPGFVIGYCQAVARGKAIEFEYEVAGIKYTNCNTFHPIPVDSIQVPGGKYLVRYSEKYPGKGRMDFNKKIE
jgi:hypothetical protein